MERLLSLIDARLRAQGRVVLALDGRSCAGKSTLARTLREQLGGNVFHMDDFFLPPALRTAARYAQPGGNVHYERFLEEILLPLTRGEDVCYRRFDCGSMTLGAPVRVLFAPVSIVEGSYALHPALRALYDVRAFLDVDAEIQRARLLAREGEEGRARFLARWVPLEERYFDGCAVRACADVLLKGETL